ncbi:MAG: MerC family mercury resistance protein, partial [Phycisphaeraceae bacterium]
MSSTPHLPLAELTQPAINTPTAAIDPAERTWLDRLGIGASLLCAIHCLAAPFLLLLLPAAGSIWSHPAVHWILALLVV